MIYVLLTSELPWQRNFNLPLYFSEPGSFFWKSLEGARASLHYLWQSFNNF